MTRIVAADRAARMRSGLPGRRIPRIFWMIDPKGQRYGDALLMDKDRTEKSGGDGEVDGDSDSDAVREISVTARLDPYAVFRDRSYRRFLLAGMAATVGGQMQNVAVGWELYERTSSPLADRPGRACTGRARNPPGDPGGPWPTGTAARAWSSSPIASCWSPRLGWRCSPGSGGRSSCSTCSW